MYDSPLLIITIPLIPKSKTSMGELILQRFNHGAKAISEFTVLREGAENTRIEVESESRVALAIWQRFLFPCFGPAKMKLKLSLLDGLR